MKNLIATAVAYFSNLNKTEITYLSFVALWVVIYLIGPATIYTYFASPLGLVELVGTIASAICVYLAIKHNQWTWFFGAIGVLFFGYLFLQYALISDAALQILFYLPMQLIGFIWWRNAAKKADNASVVKAMSVTAFVVLSVGILAMVALNGWFMAAYGPQVIIWVNSAVAWTGLSFPVVAASFPYIDALTTWLSIAAQILMIAKFRESWILWVGMDVIAIFVYFAKGLVVVSGLYGVFLVLATMGGIAWYRDYKAQQTT